MVVCLATPSPTNTTPQKRLHNTKNRNLRYVVTPELQDRVLVCGRQLRDGFHPDLRQHLSLFLRHQRPEVRLDRAQLIRGKRRQEGMFEEGDVAVAVEVVHLGGGSVDETGCAGHR